MLSKVIARCCAIKAHVVGRDETETGLRSILNFGHTIGHAIEAVSSYGTYLHGEAISIGQAAAACLSERLSGLDRRESQRIFDLLVKAGLPVQLKLRAPARKRLLQAMTLDKKAADGQARFVLARAIGEVKYGCSVPLEAVHEVLDQIK